MVGIVEQYRQDRQSAPVFQLLQGLGRSKLYSDITNTDPNIVGQRNKIGGMTSGAPLILKQMHKPFMSLPYTHKAPV